MGTTMEPIVEETTLEVVTSDTIVEETTPMVFDENIIDEEKRLVDMLKTILEGSDSENMVSKLGEYKDAIKGLGSSEEKRRKDRKDGKKGRNGSKENSGEAVSDENISVDSDESEEMTTMEPVVEETTLEVVTSDTIVEETTPMVFDENIIDEEKRLVDMLKKMLKGLDGDNMVNKRRIDEDHFYGGPPPT